MHAILLLIAGKIADAIIAAIAKWVAAKQKAKETAAKIADKVKRNKEKTEAYEKDPSDSNFSDLP
jgi:hypothetical protein